MTGSRRQQAVLPFQTHWELERKPGTFPVKTLLQWMSRYTHTYIMMQCLSLRPLKNEYSLAIVGWRVTVWVNSILCILGTLWLATDALLQAHTLFTLHNPLHCPMWTQHICEPKQILTNVEGSCFAKAAPSLLDGQTNFRGVHTVCGACVHSFLRCGALTSLC